MFAHRAPRLSAALLASAALLIAAPARADQPSQIEQVNSQVKTGLDAQKSLNVLVVPLPISNPAVGGGLVLATGLFYSPVQGGRPWVTGASGLYTSEKDWAFGLAQQADLFQGRLRLSAAAGYGDFNLDFFGIGQNAGSQGRSIRLDEKGAVAVVNALYQVHGALYFGARYRFLSVDSRLDQPLFPKHPIIPNAQLQTQISGLGPALEYDTRDQEFRPKKGIYVEGQWLFSGSDLGSDFTYNKLTTSANFYHSFTPKTVLALRASVCDASSGAPFYDLCFFGSGHDLRGYEGGQYRDHAMYAVQGEVRQDLFWRFGAVAFVGIGAVAPSFGEIGDARQLPSAGVGLRFQPSTKVPVNISVDYAWGRDSQGLYLYIGEAF